MKILKTLMLLTLVSLYGCDLFDLDKDDEDKEESAGSWYLMAETTMSCAEFNLLNASQSVLDDLPESVAKGRCESSQYGYLCNHETIQPDGKFYEVNIYSNFPTGSGISQQDWVNSIRDHCENPVDTSVLKAGTFTIQEGATPPNGDLTDQNTGNDVASQVTNVWYLDHRTTYVNRDVCFEIIYTHLTEDEALQVNSLAQGGSLVAGRCNASGYSHRCAMEDQSYVNGNRIQTVNSYFTDNQGDDVGCGVDGGTWSDI